MPRGLLGAALAVSLVGCAPPAGMGGDTDPSSRPTSSRPGGLTRAVLISDLNGAYGTIGYSEEVRRVVARITSEWRPDIVIAAGDLVAGQDPELSDGRVREMWTAFDSVVATPLRMAGIPLIAALGNHDASAYPAHARDRRLAVEHWTREGRARPMAVIDGAGYPLRYTTRHGDVFIAVWDATSQETGRDPELLGWLRTALQSAAARAARHRVVVGHLPLYPVAVGRDRAGEFLIRGDSLRRELESLGATLFISGHHHAYYPGRRGALALIHAGALGDGPRPLIGGGAARRAVTILDFAGDSLRLAAYEVGPGGTLRGIDADSLPRAICSAGQMVMRRDLPDSDPDPEAGCGRARTETAPHDGAR